MLIGVTQRVVHLADRKERRDTLDQSWTAFLHACGLDLLLLPNQHPDIGQYAKRLGVTGILLSGGNDLQDEADAVGADSAPERDASERALITCATKWGWPILGICRGMQMLNVHHGGSIVPIEGHVRTRHSVAPVNDGGRCMQSDSVVNSFHNWGITPATIASTCVALYMAGDSVEALRHRELPHLGFMWHPERNEPFSLVDVKNIRSFFDSRSA